MNKNSLTGVLITEQETVLEWGNIYKKGQEDIFPEPCDCWACGGSGCGHCS